MELNILKIGECVINVNTTGGIGKIKGIVVNIPIDQNVRPVAQPYRRIPVALEGAVDAKIKELLNAGIIEKVDGPSVWISPVVVVPKSDDDVRICIDMRRANEAVLRENHPLPCFENFLPHWILGSHFDSKRNRTIQGQGIGYQAIPPAAFVR